MTTHQEPVGVLDRTLYDPRLLVRAGSLAALGITLHMTAWSLGFHVLPPEILKGVFLTSKVPVVGGSEGNTFLRIVLINVLLGFVLVAACNLFRIGRFPLGYLPALFHWVGFGLFNGTGSFEVPTPPRPPSLTGLVTSRGCWEIMAYTIVAAATVGLFVYRQDSLFQWTARKERAVTEVSVSPVEWTAIGLALALLVAANWTEAVSVVSG